MTVYTITLEGKPYEVSPLKVKQARVILPALQKCGGTFDSTEAYDVAGKIIVAALNDGYPGINEETYPEMVVTPLEMLIALGTIQKVSGLTEAAEAVEGGKKQVADDAKKNTTAS